MKEITIYKCSDGARFDDKESAIKYERLIDDVKESMSDLWYFVGRNVDFENGYGYIQHSNIHVISARTNILRLLGKNCPELKEIADRAIMDPGYHVSIILRMADGYRNLSPIKRAIGRLNCIDANYREFGQSYFAEHPNDAKLVRLNK